MRRFVLSVASLSALMLPLAHAAAAPVLSSGATAAQVQLKTGGVVTANLTVAGVASATSPNRYDTTMSASANQSFTLVDGGLFLPDVTETLKTGLTTSRASGDLSLGSAFGTTSLANVSSLFGTSLLNLGLSAGTIASTTSVSFGADSFGGAGSSVLQGLSFSGGLLGGLALDAGLLANPLANTRLITLPGLSVILNEQLSQSTATSLFRQTNAVHIALNDYLFGGQALSGDIILGHSEASLSGFAPTVASAVPEPAGWALMLAGFGAVGFALRQRRRLPARALSLG